MLSLVDREQSDNETVGGNSWEVIGDKPAPQGETAS